MPRLRPAVRAAPAILLLLVLPAEAGMRIVFNDPPATNGIDRTVVGFIGAARRSLDVAIFQLDHPRIVEALTEAHRRGVSVRVVCEARNWNAPFAVLAGAGIGVVPDTAGGGGHGYMHDKFIVRDGSAVLTGSYNFTVSQAEDDHNGVVVFTAAPALARIYRAEFDQMFDSRLFGPRKLPQAETQAVVGGRLVEVFFSPRARPAGHLVRAIETTDSNLAFAIFSFTHEGIAEAIRRRAREGASVVGVFDRWQARSAHSKDEFLATAGCAIRRDTYPGLLHDKAAAIDAGTRSDPVAVIGSFNWSGNADRRNDENLLLIHDPRAARAVRREIETVFRGRSD